ncbi:hypothetical protein [Erythrobacter aureus]|uniref:Uncharacterized protein n=1 Tax=Erythrobacter aureus TaxID=2182384 RepID=A0A345YJH0_9SPHN|nr:hypothetical protein [Erythrobacter aureus]AXK44072.1 hypothetical protein DVR09_16600 [Erythrobacter aureus]
MARAKAKKDTQPVAVAVAPQRHLRSPGPLSPSETEIIVYAGLKDGKVVATPDKVSVNTRAVAHLITDRASIADGIAHKDLHVIEEVPAVSAQTFAIGSNRDLRASASNQAAIGGSIDLVDAVLQTAFKVTLFLEGSDDALPPEFDGWKKTKVDTKTTPPSISLLCM